MKKTYLTIFAALLSASSVFSQEVAVVAEPADTLPNWNLGGSIAVNFSNTGLSNWSAGGSNSIALGSIVDLYGNYKEGKDSWVNSINWAAGMARVGDSEQLIKKSDDQLILLTKYRRNIKENWGFAALADLRTQLLKSPVYTANPDDTGAGDGIVDEVKSDSITSGFMSPGYLITSIGWEYNKGKNFYLHASPLSLKGTFVMDDKLAAVGAYGVEPGQNVLLQLGSLVKSGWKTKVMDNVTFSTGLMLFSPYEKYGNIDVTWETLTTFKINKFLTTTFATNLVYYDAARPKIETEIVDGIEVESPKHGIQFKHVLNIGFLAKF